MINNFQKKVKFDLLVDARKMIQRENIDDIDLATNLNPEEVSSILKKMILIILKQEFNMEQLLL